MNFSKSKYCAFCQCPKILWLNKYKPEEKKEDPSKQERFEKGNVVGDLAMQLFGDFVEVTAFDQDGNLDMAKMIETTSECLKTARLTFVKHLLPQQVIFVRWIFFTKKRTATLFTKLRVQPTFLPFT